MPVPHSANISSLSAEAFADLLSGPILTISIGPDQKSWQIHHNLLNHFTSYFSNDALINGEPKRIDDHHISLPDHDPAAFRIFVKWLYQGSISDVSALVPGDKAQKWEYAYSCQNLYFLADALEIPQLKNVAIDQFRKGCYETRLVPGAEEILPVYLRTSGGGVESSPFRRLVARVAARQIMDPEANGTRDASVYRECFEKCPEFAVDVVNAIREGTGGVLLDDPMEGNGCRYHEHAEGDGCLKVVRFEDEAGPRMSE